MGEIYPDEGKTNEEKKSSKRTSTLTILEQYGTNVTQLAIEGKLDPVIGREDEILRVVQIL